MKKKPGVMVYFDLRSVLKMLNDSEKGKLFEAILAYGETGEELGADASEKLKVLWPLIRLRLNNDNTRYEHTVIKRKYAAYTRWAKQHNEEVQPYDDWLANAGYDPEDFIRNYS